MPGYTVVTYVSTRVDTESKVFTRMTHLPSDLYDDLDMTCKYKIYTL